ncbi:MAG: glycosyltransferase family 2 protein [Muribaculaceae bacterium]|nr:glycosyltransferase family 2 protein [Muribaculaceae bacterium]MDE6753120.1 glycosyltransferase family 2 protein [Muribaculaceae bacterium]
MEEEDEREKTVAVMVLYHPELDFLEKNLKAITPQVGKVYIIDNTPEGDLSGWNCLESKHAYFPLKRNLGIAAAQNIGIRYAAEEGVDLIYFLDQDSLSPAGIIENLKACRHRLLEKNIKVGAVGACPINRQNGEAYQGKKGGREKEMLCCEVAELISSGSLISTKTFQDTGCMEEDLFIDLVDHEWCWRAKAKGDYRHFIDLTTELNHQIGGGDRRLLWKKVAMPSPFRIYYLYRNVILMSGRDYVENKWKFINLVKLGLKIFYYPVFISPRKVYARNIIRGIRDGIRGLRRTLK